MTETNERKYGYVNIYRCQDCAWMVVTKDVDEGVTPFMIKCKACLTGLAQSSFYRVRQDMPYTAEWRHEIPEDQKNDTWAIDHFANGGLFLYWLTPEPSTPSTAEKLKQIGVGKKMQRVFGDRRA